MRHSTTGLRWGRQVSGMLLGMAVAQVAMAQAPEVPVYKEIKDWLVACDNTRFCEAKGFSDAESASMRITRSAGPANDLVVEIDAPDTADSPATGAFNVDGRRLDLKAFRWAPVVKAGSAHVTLAPDDADSAYRLLRRIRDSKVLSLGPSKTAPAVPLHGLAAVLLLMDDVQGRLGNETALARPGHAPASALSPAPQAPVLRSAPTSGTISLADTRALSAAVRQSQQTSLQGNECQTNLSGNNDQVEPLNDSTALVMIECMRGAYQSAYLLFRASRAEVGTANLLHLPLPPGAPSVEGESTDRWVEPSYEPRRATLAVYSKGRGLADCGTQTEWRFDGVNFSASAYRRQVRCGGAQPGDWPTLWQTR